MVSTSRLYFTVCCSSIHSLQIRYSVNLKRTQTCKNIQNWLLLSHDIMVSCHSNNMGEPVKESKPSTEKKIWHDLTHMWNLRFGPMEVASRKAATVDLGE